MADPQQQVQLPMQSEKDQVLGFLFASCEAKQKTINEFQIKLQAVLQANDTLTKENTALKAQLAGAQQPPTPQPADVPAPGPFLAKDLPSAPAPVTAA